MIEYRGYQIKAHQQFPMSYIIVTAGRGGKIPAVMSSLFTSPTYAKGVIDDYLSSKEVKNNAETSSESRD